MNNHEDAEQAVVFAWAANYRSLRHMFAIPNGAFLAGDKAARARQMNRLKKQGLLVGVSDIFLPRAVHSVSGHYNGLFIEMKRRKIDGPSKVSGDQMDFLSAMDIQGYKTAVCYGADEAIEVIKNYMVRLT